MSNIVMAKDFGTRSFRFFFFFFAMAIQIVFRLLSRMLRCILSATHNTFMKPHINALYFQAWVRQHSCISYMNMENLKSFKKSFLEN